MEEQIKKIVETAIEKINEAKDANILNDLRVKYLGKKGEFTAVLRGMKDLAAEQRPVIGGMVNKFKEKLEELISEKEKQFAEIELQRKLKEQ